MPCVVVVVVVCSLAKVVVQAQMRVHGVGPLWRAAKPRTARPVARRRSAMRSM